MRAVAFAAAALAAAPALGQDLPAGTYRLDPYHATVTFRISHLGFSDYVAGFDDIDAVLEIDPADPGSARLEAEIEVASLDLPNPPEGFFDLLMSEAWFDAGAHPVMTFLSEEITLEGDTDALVTGTFTLKGVSAPVTLSVAFNGGYDGHPMDPNARIGFSATGELSRTEFGMGFGVPPEGSTLGVGDAVRFEIEAEFTGPPMEN